MKRVATKVVLILLAVLLGFTTLALYHSPSPRHLQSFPSFPQFSPWKHEVVWKSYGEEASDPNGNGNANLDERTSDSDYKILKPDFLESVPKFFQEQLLNVLPLQSFYGLESRTIFRPQYARFLKALLDYTNYHKSLKTAPLGRTLTWQCSMSEYCGGLGDRLRGVAYTLLLSIFSRRRLIVFWEGENEGSYLRPHLVDWTDDAAYQLLRNDERASTSDSFSQPHVFKFQVVMEKSGKITNDVSSADMHYYQNVIGSNFTHVVLSTNLEPSSLLDSTRNGDQDWIRDGLHWTGLSHLHPRQLDEVVGIIFRYLFRLDEKVLREVQKASEVLGLHLYPYTALHLRTGFAAMDHHEELIRHPKLQQNVSEWHSSLRCAVATADWAVGNGSLVFLATDSNVVKSVAVVRYGPRIRTLSNVLIHVDKLDKRVHTPDPSEKEGVLVVWVEFLLLMRAKVLVMGESGFAWTASILAGMHSNQTINTKHCSH